MSLLAETAKQERKGQLSFSPPFIHGTSEPGWTGLVGVQIVPFRGQYGHHGQQRKALEQSRRAVVGVAAGLVAAKITGYV